jgi:MFS transporter, PAT family, beta-lactamase induction signal transducer AmpG
MTSIAKVFTSRRMVVVTLLGFSSGIPLALTSSTLQTWLRREKLDLTTIGVFSLVGMPYAFKFVWAPLMDRYVPPFLGRRRGWMIVTQLALLVGIGAMGLMRPAETPVLLAATALVVAFLSASQDVVIDAYNVEVLEPEERGAGSSVYVLGYRIAMLASGGGSLVLAGYLPWRGVYLIMAGAMLVGLATTLAAPEPRLVDKPPSALRAVVVESFSEFFRRTGALEVLAFIVLYRLGANLAIALNSAFFVDLGFSNLDIGAVMNGLGTFATIGGTLAGGALMVRLGLRRSLFWFGLLQGSASVAYLVLARLGHSYPAMVVAIGMEYGLSGPGLSVFQAFMMGLCDRRFTATQYALITRFMALSRYVASAPSGYLAQHLGWPGYFTFCIAMAIPALLMVAARYRRWVFPVPAAT